ncbi:glycoside hydrolase family 172 protein [Rhodopirellula islandica]|uniref:glycoside hydrolase family 172 protein n=1 Tax=Rhodopirellula islandica TaxID=595434 RepID=UPI001F306F13|nr:glycoside hydrolase family 172 protein [Rhodopirellula islandica]
MSLLHEMTDREKVARYPHHEFRLKQASSYNRASKTPDDPKGWFDNFDRNTNDTHKNYVRVEDNQGRKEYVVMEDEGAGAITRFWVPWKNQLQPGTDVVIRFYLDGASKPAIEGNMFDLFQGKGLIPFPLAHESLRSAVSFFPIPYARSCKVTMSDHPFFFQFTYREYEEDVAVKTFSMDDFQSAKRLIDTTCQKLLSPSTSGSGDVVNLKETLAGGNEQSVLLPAQEAAITSLSLKLGSYEAPNVTRHVVLKIRFDNKETVWCPIGDFFGGGIGLNPFQGWYRTVDADGTMTCRWVMPYQNNAKISVVNLGKDPVDVELSATIDDWKWDSSSMYFHAGWRGQYPVPTRPYSDWNYVTLHGRGVYVGDTLTIMNPVERWWGEGDEKIFIDGESFPSIFGTGTEDYYAYSWGGRSTDFYEHPFHAQPFSHQYNQLNRKPKIDEKNTQGFSTETRTRALDTMPFSSSLKLDMEVWSWTDCDMGYGVGVYWYGDADTKSNHAPDQEEVLNVPPVPTTKSTPRNATTSSTGHAFPNSVEVNVKNVLSKPEHIALKPQNLKRMKLKGTWSQDDQVLFKNTRIGDAVEIRIPASGSAAETLTLHATKSGDYGIVNFSVNGQPAAANVDFYSGEKPTSHGPIALGTFDPVDGVYVLRAEVTGQNKDSLGTLFGLDCVTQVPATGGF